MKMLVVEDDPHVSEFIKNGFEADGFIVDTALDGKRGAFMGKTNPYDIMILDHSLPLKNGFEICSEIRSSGIASPILFLSILGDTDKKIEGLTRGADDYLSKPFSFDELRARVKALLRRPIKMESPRITFREFVIDTEKQTVHRNGILIPFNRKEYSLFEYFVRNSGIVLSRSMIMEHVWSAEKDPFSNTIETHIHNLRKKLRTGNEKGSIIRNIAGRGYMIDA